MSFGDSLVSWVAITRFNKGMNPAVFWVYFGVIWMLLMSWCSASYVIYQTVQSGISFTEGFYHIYADYSSQGNLMYLYEVIAIALFIFWAFDVVVLSTWAGSAQWKAMDDRMAEANTTVFNAHTPLRWSTGVMHFLLSCLTGMTTMISGVALGEVANELLHYFDAYDDKTNSECSDSSCDTKGTSVQYDVIINHLVTVFYGQFVLGAISLGGYIFMLSYTSLDDEFDCEFEEGVDFNSYAGAFPYITSMTGYDDCMSKIDSVFPFFDDNKDGHISRCEDAQF
jgi:hypothetical protein